jgi:hypothetical protein
MPLVLTLRPDTTNTEDGRDKAALITQGPLNEQITIVRLKEVRGGHVRLEFDGPATVLRWPLFTDRENARAIQAAANERANHPPVVGEVSGVEVDPT